LACVSCSADARCVRFIFLSCRTHPRSLQATAYVGTNHIELQAAQNPGKHFAVCGNVSYGSGISIYDGAIGTYGYNAKKTWRYESFAGYGYNTNIAYQVANYNNLLGKPVKNYEVRSFYDKIYLQPTVSYHGDIKMYKMEYSFALGARVSAVYFKTFSYHEIDDAASTQTGQTVYIRNINYFNKWLYLLEPCLTNKFGSRGFYGILQCQFIIPYSEQIDLRYTTFSQAFILSLGIQYNLVFRERKNVQKN
jgi:hypothetical protein